MSTSLQIRAADTNPGRLQSFDLGGVQTEPFHKYLSVHVTGLLLNLKGPLEDY